MSLSVVQLRVSNDHVWLIELAAVCMMMACAVTVAPLRGRTGRLAHYSLAVLFAAATAAHVSLWHAGRVALVDSAAVAALSVAVGLGLYATGLLDARLACLYAALCLAMPPTLSESASICDPDTPALALALNSLCLFGLYEMARVGLKRGVRRLPHWACLASSIGAVLFISGGATGVVCAALTYLVRTPLTILEALVATTAIGLVFRGVRPSCIVNGASAAGWCCALWLAQHLAAELLFLWCFSSLAIASYAVVHQCVIQAAHPVGSSAAQPAEVAPMARTTPFWPFMLAGTVIMAAFGGTPTLAVGHMIARAFLTG